MITTLENTAVGEALVGRCLSGETRAWRDLHRTYFPVTAAFLRKLGVKEAELEDACQDVFVRLYRYLPSFRGGAELKTWLYRLCATEAGRIRRKRRVSEALSWLMRQELASNPPACRQELSDEIARRKVQAALDTLKPPERLVFVLYEFEGQSGEQIAKIAECPVATVWRRLHYARKAFNAAVAAGGAS
jgi:RNA polymerase sigma-70 factor, ECF subfamily